MSSDIGLIGLAVMGSNLVLNMERNGFKVAVYNRTTSKTEDFINANKGKNIVGTKTMEEFVGALKTPRVVMIMVAANAVEACVKSLEATLEKGDIIIDGGNSNWLLSEARWKDLEAKGFLYVGCGISGGEEGALNGPSIMPGGSEAAWDRVKPILQGISAKVEGTPCCQWIGPGGTGHFVKTVHNGIEYGDMQLICEVYDIMKRVMGLNNQKMYDLFEEWSKTEELGSYLIEIARDILIATEKGAAKDDYLVEKIVDTAGQKGTGKWTLMNAVEEDVPLSLIGESVFSRNLSFDRQGRINASKILKGPCDESIRKGKMGIPAVTGKFASQLKEALFASKVVSYAQGFSLIQKVSKQHQWNLNYGAIALAWRGGCIIRSRFLYVIKNAYDEEPNLQNLLMYKFFADRINKAQEVDWRNVVSVAVQTGIPCPALSSALCYYDQYRTERLPANLLQAMRDLFGAHTYAVLGDANPEQMYHTEWRGTDSVTNKA